jgi:hypothetical protein
MTYNLKPDNDIICQCGCIVDKYYMEKHLKTAKRVREMVGRENVEYVYTYVSYVCMYIYMYVCMYVYIYAHAYLCVCVCVCLSE